MDVKNKLIMYISVLSLATTLVACGGDKATVTEQSDASDDVATGVADAVSNEPVVNSTQVEVAPETEVVSEPPPPIEELANTEEEVPVVDETPPKSESITPSDGSKDIELETTVSTRFDEDMFAQTVTADSFVLKNAQGKNVNASVSFDPLTNKAVLTPDASLGLLATYMAELKSDMTDLAGNALADTSWKFTTRDGQWGEVETLFEEDQASADNFNEVRSRLRGVREPFHFLGGGISGLKAIAGSPVTAIDANGAVIAAWAQNGSTQFGRFGSSGQSTIYVNRLDPETGWGTPETIEVNQLEEPDLSYNAVITPKISMNSNGDAIIIWVKQYIHRDFFKGFNDEAAARVSVAPSAVSIRDPRVSPIRFDIVVSKYNAATKQWSDAKTIVKDRPGRYVSGVSLDMNEKGDAIIAWSDYIQPIEDFFFGFGRPAKRDGRNDDSYKADVNAITYNATDGTWSDIQGLTDQLTPDIVPLSLPDATIDSKGRSIVAWIRYDGEQGSIIANHHSVEQGWEKDARLVGEPILFQNTGFSEFDGQQYNLEVSVSSNEDGQAIAIWSEYNGTQRDLFANHYTPENGWGTSEKIEKSDSDVLHSGMGIAMGSSGKAFAIWLQLSESKKDYNVMSNTFSPGEGWGTEKNIGTAASNIGICDEVSRDFFCDVEILAKVTVPRIGVDANNNAIATWQQLTQAEQQASNNTFGFKRGTELSLGDKTDRIMVNRYSSEDGWGTATSIDGQEGYVSTPEIAMNASGKAAVLWFQYEGSSVLYVQNLNYMYGYDTRPIAEKTLRRHRFGNVGSMFNLIFQARIPLREIKSNYFE